MSYLAFRMNGQELKQPSAHSSHYVAERAFASWEDLSVAAVCEEAIFLEPWVQKCGGWEQKEHIRLFEIHSVV